MLHFYKIIIEDGKEKTYLDDFLADNGIEAKVEPAVCRVHGDHHKFVQCDEWGATCVCGTPEK